MTPPEPVRVTPGDGPLVLGVPHAGTYVPPDLLDGLNEHGRALADTDWHVPRLYADLLPDVTVVEAVAHRYVIDCNRPPDGESLYPGQNTTGLCPTTDFEGRPIHRDGAAPDGAEQARRLEAWHRPYHEALADALARARARHGVAVLYDAHSIRCRLPFLFAGLLPDFNIGTNGGTSCARRVAEAVETAVRAAIPDGFTMVRDGRFKGGWTTRHYGRPDEGVHAVQMELAQAAYMDEAPPWTYRPERADRLRRHLRRVLLAARDTARVLARGT
ncbi:N-formylglutamate deformylase [Roseospira navarrensis]|uniref:N-formylglutamate deformylase n=1 Tax=Roseospira navarrensis TaxID=140058 RepID=A0A7X1ZCQ9_9PROT|nr:N-formylglutamate deformylase [Roseospira navarrensis]MQX35131.1 N-formylglutamate deformylase [Roseospira navarrensis]